MAICCRYWAFKSNPAVIELANLWTAELNLDYPPEPLVTFLIMELNIGHGAQSRQASVTQWLPGRICSAADQPVMDPNLASASL